MKPQTIGRTLGIGLRVAGRVAAHRMAGPAVPAAAATRDAVTAHRAQVAAVGEVAERAGYAAERAGRGVTAGIRGLLRPFGKVGGILWLEVTGVFFLLPVIVFGPRMWQTRASWLHGPEHRIFVCSAVLVILFLYLGISSFWRAHRRSAAK